MSRILLASSSAYRRKQLLQLGLQFTTEAPNIDETAGPNETPLELAKRLSQEKAMHLSKRFPDHIIIGSDQTAECDQRLLSKAGTMENARDQLIHCQGKDALFYTGICIYEPRTDTILSDVVETLVSFRELDTEEIDHYLERERPLDCAGSFKVEGLGIALFEAVKSDDPSALVGLPLITVCRFLRQLGHNPVITI